MFVSTGKGLTHTDFKTDESNTYRKFDVGMNFLPIMVSITLFPLKRFFVF
jgi:hypothetical protein